jgi:nucleoid DNA-binding protein
MTKKDIVRQVAETLDITQILAKEVVQMTFDLVVEAIEKEGRIELRNFGVFEVKERRSRKARNPKTGEEVMVPPKKVVIFKPGKEMCALGIEGQHGAAEETAETSPSENNPVADNSAPETSF